MQIEINGELVRSDCQTLQELLIEKGFTGESFAVAVNGEFVARSLFAGYRVNNGDQLDIVSPIAGG